MKVAFIILFFGVSFCFAKINSHKRGMKNQVETSGENFLNQVLVPTSKRLWHFISTSFRFFF
jgi:hypothetical protein